MSASVEFANVGTPRKCETVLCTGGFPAAGAAGIGIATDEASTAARITLPNCFNVGTSVLLYPIADHVRRRCFYPKICLRSTS
jgi:hypothetical protein